MPELASAWVTLAVRATGMQRDITRVMEQANRSARLNPKIDAEKLGAQGSRAGRAFGEKFSLAARIETARFGAQGEAAGQAFGSRFSSSAKKLTALGGVTAGVAGLASQFKQVMSVGMDWTTNMNTLSAVTGASAAELKRAGDAARALGNDVTIPATSANDAAAAMTELAKGGFTVQQSMDAAQGSLRLAAAAGISATEAATIQSQALQAFGLQAGEAGKISDTLANAANASSAEITDVAQALQQAGTVANQFGVSSEDTAAAIALLANNGIKGSDAGTLLKTSLLALADQGKPAQEAIHELGLTVYDAAGRFVGLHSLYQQLGKAAAELTPEQYQAATATLFGSDAMRIAGVAAKDGSASYDAMRKAIDRQGAAADVAAAKTKGLPGAWERVKNSLESLQLTAYDALEGPVTSVVSKLSVGLDGLGDSWEKLASNPAVRGLVTETRTALSGLVDSVRQAGPALGGIARSLGSAAASVGGAAWKAFVTTLQAAAGVLHTVTPALAVIAGLMSDHQGLVTAAALAWAGFRLVPEILGRIAPATSAASAAVTTLGEQTAGAFRGFRDQMRLQQSLAAMSGQQISTAGSAWATLAARGTGAMSALRGAATGVVNALGGGLSVALMAGGAAFAYIAAQNQKSEQSLHAYQDAVHNTGRAQIELNEALQKSRGAFDDAVKPAAVERIRSISTELEAAAKRTGSFLDKFRDSDRSINPFSGPAASYSDKIKAEADAAKDALKAIDALKLSQQSLSDAAYGSQAGFEAMVGQLEAAGVGGQGAADALRRARTEFMAQQQVAANTAPGVYEMASAMRTLADDTASAADKSNALKAALDALNPARTKADAQAAHTTAVAAVQQSDIPVDAAAGAGKALFDASGGVNTLLVNGVELNDALKRLVDTTVDVATKGGDMGATMAANEEAFAVLARRFQTDIPSIKAAFDSLGGPLANAGAQLSGIAKLFQSGQIPTDHPIKVDAPGGQEVLTLLTAMGEKVHEGNDKTIEVDAPLGKEVLQLLEQMHYQAQIKDGKLILVKLDGVDAAKAAIEELKRPENKLIRINTLREAFGAPAVDAPPPGQPARRANGAIVPMANGGFNGLKWIIKPEDAGLYAGRGAGTIFAEKETGGEAYIPLAAGKRGRSTQILSEVARMFGMELTAREDGGITPEALRQFASGIAGRPYRWGAGEGDTFDTDCSGAQSTVANFITGGTGRFGTGDEASALLSRGFQMGDPPKGISAYWVGWRADGGGGGHTAGTIVDPFNGNVNIEMGGRSGGGQFGGTAAGASMFPQRAWIALAGGDDPNGGGSFSSSSKVASAASRVTTARQSTAEAKTKADAAQAELDQLTAQGASAKKIAAAEKKRDKAQEALTKKQQRQVELEEKLTEAKEQSTKRGGGSGEDGSSLGQSIISGMLQTLGLDGSLFSNPLEWPNFKSLMAGLNFGGNLLQSFAAGGEEGGGGLGLPDLKMPGIADLLKTPNPGPTELKTDHLGTGAAPGPTDEAPFIGQINVNGANPTAVVDKINGQQISAVRKYGGPAVKRQ